MSRWLLALLFAFGSVTFLTGCPAGEEEPETPDTEEIEEKVDEVEEEVEEETEG
ncbi:MAG: hypothetical protein AAGB26_12700 [Planctomycetota bacterium]